MCGIFGTTNPQKNLIPLIQDNLERGTQALSLFTPTIRLVYDNPHSGVWLPLGEPWVLGHCQAPTGKPSPDRHPFQWHQWFVAHNGVIHNSIDTGSFRTDSATIALVLEMQGMAGLRFLDGTFACWAHNTKENQTYLFSWVNPIHVSTDTFSSKPFEGSVQLPEGLVVKWPGCEPVAEFEGKSHPYRAKVSSEK